MRQGRHVDVARTLAYGGGAIALAALASRSPVKTPLRVAALACAALGVHELLGRPLPFLRWSFIRMGLAGRSLFTKWQVGDGREGQAEAYVISHAQAGDLDAAIAAFDRFAYDEKFLFNVGDEKGAILDAAMHRTRPRCVLELGTYLGYSALRIARNLPEGGHLYSVEQSAENAAIARRIVAHARVDDRVTIVEGSLGDGGRTLNTLAFPERSVDVLFIDHDKDAYAVDLERIIDAGWLHPGSVILADNVRMPGAPAYRALIEAGEGTRWHTRVHDTHAEYQSVLRDQVFESTFLG